jgi:hypothetical protein
MILVAKEKIEILHDFIRPPGLYGPMCAKSLLYNWFSYLVSYKSGRVVAAGIGAKLAYNCSRVHFKPNEFGFAKLFIKLIVILGV